MRPGDYAVVAFALVLLPWLYLTHWGGGGLGDLVQIRDGAGHEITLVLGEDGEVEVEGPLGRSVIEVRDGAARFVRSPCQGKVCIHSGWLRSGGDFTACLPNRISLTVAAAGRQYDSINF